jgi:RNA polymerase sigma-70 factor (ECF subfamily)
MAYVRLQAGAAVRAKDSLSDLAQSVCVEVLRDAKGFVYRGEAQFRQWLFVQVVHKIQNRHRHHRAAIRDVRREVGPQPAGSDADVVAPCYATLCTPSVVAMGREQVAALEAAFAELPPEQRQAVLMRRLAGLGYAEIAAELGKSEGAVRNLVYRGVAQLAARLGARATKPGDA